MVERLNQDKWANDASFIFRWKRNPKYIEITEKERQNYEKEAAPSSMNLKQQICKTQSFFLSWKRGEEGRSELDQVVFYHFIDDIFNESWDGVSVKSQIFSYFSYFLEEWPRYTPKMGILALLNRKTKSSQTRSTYFFWSFLSLVGTLRVQPLFSQRWQERIPHLSVSVVSICCDLIRGNWIGLKRVPKLTSHHIGP